MHRGYRRAILVTIIARFMCEAYLKKSRLYAIITAEKRTKAPVMRRRELHKRLPISKTISKNFLDKFLDTGMLYGTGIFRGSNKKEPKTLVNTGVSASFIVCYHRAKSVNFWLVDVPWKPFADRHVGSNPTPSARKKHTFVYQDNVCFFQRNSPSASEIWLRHVK